MKKYFIFITVVLGITLGCSTVPVEEAPPEPEPREEEISAEAEQEKSPEPEYETVKIPFKIKETVYFNDGVVDRYVETSYIEDTSLVEREETYNTYDELIEAVVYEYSEGLPARKLTYGPDSKLRSYKVFEYNAEGLLKALEYYSAGGNLQTLSTYEYDDKGRKIRWSVYGSSKNLLSYTEYLYDDRGRQTEIRIYSPDNTLEDGFDIEYDGEGRLPVREIHYTAAGAVVQIEEYTVENGLVMEKRIFTPSSGTLDLEYRFEYEYGDRGELLRESVFGGNGELIEYREMEYALKEVTRPVDTAEGRSSQGVLLCG